MGRLCFVTQHNRPQVRIPDGFVLRRTGGHSFLCYGALTLGVRACLTTSFGFLPSKDIR